MPAAEENRVVQENSSYNFFEGIPDLVSAKFRFVEQPNGVWKLEEAPRKKEEAGATGPFSLWVKPLSVTRKEKQYGSETRMSWGAPYLFFETKLFEGKVVLQFLHLDGSQSERAVDVRLISWQYLPERVLKLLEERMACYPQKPILVKGKFAPVLFVIGRNMWESELFADVTLDFWLYEVQDKHICVNDITCVDYAPCPNFPTRGMRG